jgi:hypothetical protein
MELVSPLAGIIAGLLLHSAVADLITGSLLCSTGDDLQFVINKLLIFSAESKPQGKRIFGRHVRTVNF